MFMVWMLIAAPASGLILAQLPPRLGARHMDWREGLKYGFAYFGALVMLIYGYIVFTDPFARNFYVLDVYWQIDWQINGVRRWWVATAFVLTTVAFAFVYYRRLPASASVAGVLSLAHTSIVAATIGFWKFLNQMIGWLLQ
ncbi:MAG: hypothetical protein IT368_08660 [Candidatus Hydrogenedentes bacterium]|nr:hypothetical protein [Candidatus Hydrogenedentota bacterium]